MTTLIPAWWGTDPTTAGKPYRPCNATEGECFQAKFCNRCQLNEDRDCAILGATMAYNVDEPRYPKEWTHDVAGMPLCTAFVDEREELTRPRCSQTLDMFEDLKTKAEYVRAAEIERPPALTPGQCDALWRGIRCGLQAGHEGKHQLSRVPHLCHWPGCTVEVPPAMWGCKKHWFKLPLHLRNRIWATYKPGQEINKTPSPAYIEAAEAVQQWIANHHQEPA